MILVLQHLYFNNKTSSPYSSSINAALSDSSSWRIEFKMSFDWSSYSSVSRGWLEMTGNAVFSFRYVEKFVLQQIRVKYS